MLSELEKLDNCLKGRNFLVGDSVTIADVALFSYYRFAFSNSIGAD